MWIRYFEVRMSNYFWIQLKKVAVFYKRIEVAIELNVYFKKMFTENKTDVDF